MNLPDTLKVSAVLLLGTIIFFFFILIVGLSSVKLPQLIRSLTYHFFGGKARNIYEEIFAPSQTWIAWSLVAVLF